VTDRRHGEPSGGLLGDRALLPEVLDSAVVFDGRVWDIRRDRFVLEDPASGARHEIVREYMDHTGAVAVLAMDDDGRVLLIRQYRHAVRSAELELPAGLLDIAEEDPLTAAQRELAEEVDLLADRWDLLCEFVSSPGGSNEALRVYLARGISAAPAVFDRTEEEAGIELVWTTLDEAVDAVLARRAQNSILAIAILTAKLEADRGWTGLGDAQAPWPRHPSNLY
jgi:ADP-ribose pyrophosphatase